jgi:hypothetical protein
MIFFDFLRGAGVKIFHFRFDPEKRNIYGRPQSFTQSYLISSFHLQKWPINPLWNVLPHGYTFGLNEFQSSHAYEFLYVKRGKLARYRQIEDIVNRETPIEKLNGVNLDDVTWRKMCQIGVRTYENLRFWDNFYQIPGLIKRGRGRVTQKKISRWRAIYFFYCLPYTYTF